MSEPDFDLEEPLSLEVVAEIVGARRSVIVRLAQQGLIEAHESETGQQVLPHRAVIQIRRMQRLRRDLGVNFAGAAVILDLVRRLDEMNHELTRLRLSVK